MRVGSFVALSTLLLLSSCAKQQRSLRVEALTTPVPVSGLVPQATGLRDGRVLLSWQTPLEGGGYRFEMSIFDGMGWSERRTIAQGASVSMFTADLPEVAQLADGKLLAAWELRDIQPDDPYATAIQTAVSSDDGRNWSAPQRPYAEALAGQHSFLSLFPLEGDLGVVWLDAMERAKVRQAHPGHKRGGEDSETGSIGLRYAVINGKGDCRDGGFVDPITCECCPTSAAVTSRGPLVVYRGRTEAPGTKPADVQTDRPTVRDIYAVRFEQGRWTNPRLVHPDNWVINACPDNGPAVDATGPSAVVAWWTRSRDEPKVQVAFSRDAGSTFGEAFRVDQQKGEGQVTVALLPGGRSALIGWLEKGQTWVRQVNDRGELGPAAALGPSPPHSRLPRWISRGEQVLAAWTSSQNGTKQVRFSRINMDR